MYTSKKTHQQIGYSLKALFFISLFSISLTKASGQGSIQGKIIDSSDGITLPGAHIVIKTGNSIVADVSDDEGRFWLKPLDPGKYDVEVTFVGYQKVIMEDVIVYSDQITRLDEIKMGIKELGGPIIIGYEEPLIRDDGGMRQTMRSKELDMMNNKNDIKATLVSISTDLSMDQSTRKIHFRGSRADDFVYIIDGMKQRGGEVHIPSGAIKSMSVYSGGIPAQYGDFTGGVIVIETKGYFDWLADQD
ncbi:MAG: TonB-dependent receptor [Bacteroidales bacterium]|nr:TonB-dependent receptor [Bacteroidales bacterium]